MLFNVVCLIKTYLEDCFETFTSTRFNPFSSHFQDAHKELLNQEFIFSSVIKQSAPPCQHTPRELPPLPLSLSCPVDEITLPPIQINKTHSKRSCPSPATPHKWSRLQVQDQDDEDRTEIEFDDLAMDVGRRKRQKLSQVDQIYDILVRHKPSEDAPQLSSPLPVLHKQFPAADPPPTFLYHTFLLRFDELER
ncbi:hypothetical protein EW146_g7943 [Bondarzewia mesenterica]|uniref:Uncharacterized protein n=1 Tax=Bondarzewia mesenterica TaxID=1095465 RepID=A0A4S4LNU3_9AGAM|nr:hypothetical protein EW146_g7943 [Bondarzewia mesenterica]